MAAGLIIQTGFVAAGWLALIIFTVFATFAMFVFDGMFTDTTNIGQYTILAFVAAGVLVLWLRRHTRLRWLLPVLPWLGLVSGAILLARGFEQHLALYMALILTPLVWALGLRLRQMWRSRFETNGKVASWTMASAGVSIIVWFLQTEGIDGLKDAWSDMVNLTYDPDITGIVFVLIILSGCIAGLTYRPVSGPTPLDGETSESGRA